MRWVRKCTRIFKSVLDSKRQRFWQLNVLQHFSFVTYHRISCCTPYMNDLFVLHHAQCPQHRVCYVWTIFTLLFSQDPFPFSAQRPGIFHLLWPSVLPETPIYRVKRWVAHKYPGVDYNILLPEVFRTWKVVAVLPEQPLPVCNHS